MISRLDAFIVSGIYVLTGVLGVITLGYYRPMWSSYYLIRSMRRQLRD